jgi:hypothetical protein
MMYQRLLTNGGRKELLLWLAVPLFAKLRKHKRRRTGTRWIPSHQSIVNASQSQASRQRQIEPVKIQRQINEA